MKIIVQGNAESKTYEVIAYETPAISQERDPVRRARLINVVPKKLPNFAITAPSEDAAKGMVKDRYAKQRRHLRAFSRSKPSDPRKFAGAFVVYVEPAR